MKNEQTILAERVIGFDSHPDTFTAALVRGPTPAAAIVENERVVKGLENWYLRSDDKQHAGSSPHF
jgi:hypothetical protein